MMNIIRADLYRLVRGKALYVTLAFLIVIIIILVFAGTNISPGLSPKSLGLDIGDLSVASGASSAYSQLVNSNLVIYFMLPLAVAVAASMFSSNAAKNEITTGMSRIKIYFAKSVLSVLLSWATYILFIGGGILAATIVYGAGDWSSEYVAYVLKAFGSQLLVITAYSFIAVFLCFVFKNSGAVTGIYIAFCNVPQFVIVMLGIALNNQELQQGLLKYDLVTVLQMFPMINLLSAGEIIRSYAIAIVYIIAATAGGVALFRKAEIK
jgi:ABC-type transport system involved in multi-copper enzyme maturation permease subunit